MDTEQRNLDLYSLRIDGSVLPLRDHDIITTIVARAAEGEMENALVMVTPEQAAKLPEFLRILEIQRARDGIYVGHTGTWYAVKHGAVAQSGHWEIPRDVFPSFSEGNLPNEVVSAGEVISTAEVVSPAVRGENQSGPRERDVVCGMTLRPGQEEANATYQGQTYHFCSAECRDLFLKNPAQYVQSHVGAG